MPALIDAFGGRSGRPDLRPHAYRDETDRISGFVKDRINAGAYRAGAARTQRDYERHADTFFDALAEMDSATSTMTPLSTAGSCRMAGTPSRNPSRQTRIGQSPAQGIARQACKKAGGRAGGVERPANGEWWATQDEHANYALSSALRWSRPKWGMLHATGRSNATHYDAGWPQLLVASENQRLSSPMSSYSRSSFLNLILGR